MTSLQVSCGLAPPIKNSGYAYGNRDMMVLLPFLDPEVSMCLFPIDMTLFFTYGTHSFLKEPEKAVQQHIARLCSSSV